jgi:hypothetical protein
VPTQSVESSGSSEQETIALDFICDLKQLINASDKNQSTIIPETRHLPED